MKTFNAKQARRGFTMIELLVTIGIIGVLVGIAAFALRGAQQAGRDGRRKSDLEQIRSGLEMYRSSCINYPSSLIFGNALVGVAPCSGTFMETVPEDISYPDRQYSYNYDSANNDYDICASLEVDPVPALDMTDYTCGSCGANACNYAVTSP